MLSERVQELSSRRLEDVFSVTTFCFQDVFKTSSKTKYCYAEDLLKAYSRHVMKMSSKPLEDQEMFAGYLLLLLSKLIKIVLLVPFLKLNSLSSVTLQKYF